MTLRRQLNIAHDEGVKQALAIVREECTRVPDGSRRLAALRVTAERIENLLLRTQLTRVLANRSKPKRPTKIKRRKG